MDVRQRTLLTQAEARALIESAQAGDRKAQARLDRRFEPFIWAEARAAVDRSTLDEEDAQQIAALEFIKAIQKWDASRGARLATHAR